MKKFFLSIFIVYLFFISANAEIINDVKLENNKRVSKESIIAFGNIKIQYMKAFSDLNKREFATLVPLILLTLVMGIYPEIFLDPMHLSCNNLLAQLELGTSYFSL